MLDANLFPHIFDAIFAYAVANANLRQLLHLRGISRELRDHIARIWYHAELDDHDLRDLGTCRGRPVARVSLPSEIGYPWLLDVRRAGIW